MGSLLAQTWYRHATAAQHMGLSTSSSLASHASMQVPTPAAPMLPSMAHAGSLADKNCNASMGMSSRSQLHHFSTSGSNKMDSISGRISHGSGAPTLTLSRSLSSHIKGDVNLLKQLLEAPAAYAQGPEILDSIVKVYTVHSRPNYFLPWQVCRHMHKQPLSFPQANVACVCWCRLAVLLLPQI